MYLSKKDWLTYLPGFLGAELDERRPTQEESEHVGHDVIDHHHQDRKDEPDQTWNKYVYKKIWLTYQFKSQAAQRSNLK